jgi:hypothetical protein
LGVIVLQLLTFLVDVNSHKGSASCVCCFNQSYSSVIYGAPVWRHSLYSKHFYGLKSKCKDFACFSYCTCSKFLLISNRFNRI